MSFAHVVVSHYTHIKIVVPNADLFLLGTKWAKNIVYLLRV